MDALDLTAELSEDVAASGPYIFDTNVIDAILGDNELCDLIARSSKCFAEVFYMTHLAIDEIERISRERDGRRCALLQVLVSLPATRIPTSIAVMGISRFGECRFGGEVEDMEFSRLTGGNPRHAEDAMLALTARSVGATVVSVDKDLRRMSRELSIICVTPMELRKVLVARLVSVADQSLG